MCPQTMLLVVVIDWYIVTIETDCYYSSLVLSACLLSLSYSDIFIVSIDEHGSVCQSVYMLCVREP